MKKSQITKYSEEEKLSFLRKYSESGLSKREFGRIYGLRGQSSLISWLRRYGSGAEVVPLSSEESEEDEMSNYSKEEYRKAIKEQKKRIKELEKALEFSRLETRVRDMMIDKAEKYFDIQIRKKSGAK